MAIDLGDVIPLAVFIANDLGVPENAGAVTLTITQPDGTVATPQVTNTTAGVYTANFTTTQVGRHAVRWVATGANANAESDEFNVQPADLRPIISLDDARTALGTVGASNVKDEELRNYLSTVTSVIENITGPILQATKTWTVDGGNSQVLLPSPAASVISVTDTSVLLAPGSDYTVNLRSGIVSRGTLLYPFRFLPGIQNVTVVYTVGGTTVPSNVALAAQIILRQLWLVTGRQRQRPAMGQDAPSPVGFSVPNAALELLHGTPNNVPGFA